MENIGKRIRYARKKKGLTQLELATLVSTTQQTICDYEVGKVGKNRPDVHLLSRIAENLDVPFLWLLAGK